MLLSESDSLWRKYRHMHIADLTAVRWENRLELDMERGEGVVGWQ